jgi:hypothetical protein
LATTILSSRQYQVRVFPERLITPLKSCLSLKRYLMSIYIRCAFDICRLCTYKRRTNG